MSGIADPTALTIAQAARAIREGQLTAVQLTEATLARIERLNPELNAYLHVDRDVALAQARDADAEIPDGAARPLRGIPICIKDIIDVAGVPTTAGAAVWRRSPQRDATLVARLRQAGAVLIGKGHTVEFAYGADGRNPHVGDCVNPYDPTRMCGGSSSGPAVATATGMALGAIGSDTSGSIRIPASFCGLVGIRPTLGLVPLDGVLPLAWSYDTAGPMTRTVEDAALLLEVISASPLGGWQPAELPAPLQGVRIGVLEQLLELAEDYVQAAMRDTLARLEEAGAELVTVSFDLMRHINAFHVLIQHVESAEAHRPWFDVQQPHYSPTVRLRLEAGRLPSAGSYLRAQQARRLLIDEVAGALEHLDALLAPSTPLVAPPRVDGPVTLRGEPQDVRTALLSCCLFASQIGAPVVAVPIGEHMGLPFGMQIIGEPLSEPSLLTIAALCERGWSWRGEPAVDG